MSSQQSWQCTVETRTVHFTWPLDRCLVLLEWTNSIAMADHATFEEGEVGRGSYGWYQEIPYPPKTDSLEINGNETFFPLQIDHVVGSNLWVVCPPITWNVVTWQVGTTDHRKTNIYTKKYVLLKKGFFYFEKSGIHLFKAKENGRYNLQNTEEIRPDNLSFLFG